MSMEKFRKRKIEDFSDFRLKQMKKNVPSEFMCLELSGVHNWAPQYSRKRSKKWRYTRNKNGFKSTKNTHVQKQRRILSHILAIISSVYLEDGCLCCVFENSLRMKCGEWNGDTGAHGDCRLAFVLLWNIDLSLLPSPLLVHVVFFGDENRPWIIYYAWEFSIHLGTVTFVIRTLAFISHRNDRNASERRKETAY